jgi:hypothetical protein
MHKQAATARCSSAICGYLAPIAAFGIFETCQVAARHTAIGHEKMFRKWNIDASPVGRTRNLSVKRILLTGFAACALMLAPTLSASAMPSATPDAIRGDAGGAVIQVRGGHMGHHGGRGHHYGWGGGRGHHYGWRHHH